MRRRKKLIVEVDGGQHADSRNQERDAYLQRRAWRILRFWNNDVLQQRSSEPRSCTQLR